MIQKIALITELFSSLLYRSPLFFLLCLTFISHTSLLKAEDLVQWSDLTIPKFSDGTVFGGFKGSGAVSGFGVDQNSLNWSVHNMHATEGTYKIGLHGRPSPAQIRSILAQANLDGFERIFVDSCNSGRLYAPGGRQIANATGKLTYGLSSDNYFTISAARYWHVKASLNSPIVVNPDGAFSLYIPQTVANPSPELITEIKILNKNMLPVKPNWGFPYNTELGAPQHSVRLPSEIYYEKPCASALAARNKSSSKASPEAALLTAVISADIFVEGLSEDIAHEKNVPLEVVRNHVRNHTPYGKVKQAFGGYVLEDVMSFLGEVANSPEWRESHPRAPSSPHQKVVSPSTNPNIMIGMPILPMGF